MIVLHESHRPAYSLGELTIIETLIEKTTFVAEHPRLEEDHIRDGRTRIGHQNTRSRSTCRRYWP